MLPPYGLYFFPSGPLLRSLSLHTSVRNYSGHTIDSETRTMVTTGLFLILRGLFFHFPRAWPYIEKLVSLLSVTTSSFSSPKSCLRFQTVDRLYDDSSRSFSRALSHRHRTSITHRSCVCRMQVSSNAPKVQDKRAMRKKKLTRSSSSDGRGNMGRVEGAASGGRAAEDACFEILRRATMASPRYSTISQSRRSFKV
jgi:hypothetical protein